jgi:LacI family transcriptional regulator
MTAADTRRRLPGDYVYFGPSSLILMGTVSMTDTVKSLQDIADICSVSISTVSRVLNHEPGISRQTARRVMEVAERYNFSLAKRKRPLSRAQLRLMLVVPDPSAILDNPFFDIGELLQSVGSAFSREKKIIETFSFSQLTGPDYMPLQSSDGIIFAFGDVGAGIRDLLHEKDIPHVFLNRVLDNDNYVSCNHFKGTLRLREHLAVRGYAQVGYLGCAAIPVNVDRKRGYRIGTLEAVGRVDESLTVEVASVGDIGSRTIRLFMDRECDAVMCFNDNFAIRFIKEMADMGKKVPDDMAVTGFDDSPLRKVFTPAITTMSLSTFEMGFFAARWLRDNIQHRESRRIQLEVNGTLIVGQSTTRGGGGD